MCVQWWAGCVGAVKTAMSLIDNEACGGASADTRHACATEFSLEIPTRPHDPKETEREC